LRDGNRRCPCRGNVRRLKKIPVSSSVVLQVYNPSLSTIAPVLQHFLQAVTLAEASRPVALFYVKPNCRGISGGPYNFGLFVKIFLTRWLAFCRRRQFCDLALCPLLIAVAAFVSVFLVWMSAIL
jgi:hypothetical protein